MEPCEPEPTVEFEAGYEAREVTLSKACGLVWKCRDIAPGGKFDLLEGKLESLNHGKTELRRRTYAACPQAMAGAVREVEVA